MSKMRRGPDGTYKFSNGLDAHTAPPVADFETMAKDPGVKIIITVDDNGRIMSYNHPLTAPAQRLTNKTSRVPYTADGIWDSATIVMLIYQERNDAEVGYWTTSGGTRIMIG